MKTLKTKLLAKKLEITQKEAKELITSGDYSVCTDSEADERATEYIKESLWAFNANFLAGHLKKGISIEVVEAIQKNDKCEDNNEAILCLVDNLKDLVQDAIAHDGRGHFLSSYDGDELELGNNFFAYRNN